jgi:hypothetical protein
LTPYLEVDQEETVNKAYNPIYFIKTNELKYRLIEYFRKEGYMAPLDGDNWKKYPKKEMPKYPDAYLLFQDPERTLPNIPGYKTESNSKKHF